VLGSGLILALAAVLPLGHNAVQLSWLTLLICTAWGVILALLAREYHHYASRHVMPA
jgi:hypothetical protein